MSKNIFKSSLTSKLLLCFFIVHSYSACASEINFLKKYTYGKLSKDGQLRISSSQNSKGGGYFFIKDDDTDKSNQLSIVLSVKQQENEVLASISFQNKSKEDYFIHISRLPFNPGKKNDRFYLLCENIFNIVSGNIQLDFLGSRCDLDYDLFINDEMSEWVEIKKNKDVSFDIVLNGSYLFLPGTKEYDIRTFDYIIAKNKWFVLKHINEKTFSIMDFSYSECRPEYIFYYVQKLNEICDSNIWKTEAIQDFMSLYFPKGDENNNYFLIGSNKTSVNINGDKVKSFYNTKSRFRSWSQYHN